MGRKFLPGDIVEVVLGVKEHHRVVTFAQITVAGRLGVALIFAGHMIGNKIHDHLEPGVVSALDQRLKFSHAVLHVDGHIGTHIIIVTNGIGRAGLAFHHMRVAWSDALS